MAELGSYLAHPRRRALRPASLSALQTPKLEHSPHRPPLRPGPNQPLGRAHAVEIRRAPASEGTVSLRGFQEGEESAFRGSLSYHSLPPSAPVQPLRSTAFPLKRKNTTLFLKLFSNSTHLSTKVSFTIHSLYLVRGEEGVGVVDRRLGGGRRAQAGRSHRACSLTFPTRSGAQQSRIGLDSIMSTLHKTR